ncbi:hypothetical protein O4J56_13715 [Nocardiopsis sp. RSe5-2]|uniref:Translation initiation factor 2 n=1 Tax=Nocardiopsis endophytica TaxID=3018445 RepID=A0ABT4U417_9ACTN|nr:hypothetical protein [Nocardiopsis endophytica]MDA2811693.1 hypothetical protein [Nocardiopsis endophytica]
MRAAPQRPSAPAPQRPSAPAPQADGRPLLWDRSVDEIERWTTWKGPVLLAVARTLTSTVRLLDALTLLRGDPRVLTVFTCDEGSAFSSRTERLLAESGAAYVPWERAHGVPASLILTASENVDLTRLGAPVVVLPHGIGFQKYVPDSESGERRLSGVVREEFAHRPDIVTVLSHPSQREQLRKESAVLADSAEAVGDHVHDRVRAGTRRRPLYRARLGTGAGDRLVVLTSTWGDQGLLGSEPDLPRRLLAELPLDRYRVAAVLHPNIWTAHGTWGVRQALAPALDAGLLLLPPEQGWEAALSAADCVIGDHGSVTLYAAAADVPVALGAFGEESVPETAIGTLAQGAARLDLSSALRPQVEAVIDGHTPGLHSDAVEQAFAYRGAAADRLRALLYREIGLSVPDTRRGALRGPAEPEPEAREVTAFEVMTHIEGVDAARPEQGGRVSVERFPAAVRDPAEPPDGWTRHLAVSETEPDEALARSASVILRADGTRGTGDADVPGGPGGAARSQTADVMSPEGWATDALKRYPGALMAVADAEPTGGSGVVAFLRDGGTVSVRGDRPIPLEITAALAYAVVRSASKGGAAEDCIPNGPVRVACEAQEWSARVDRRRQALP